MYVSLQICFLTSFKAKIYFKDKENNYLLPKDLCQLSGSVVVADCHVNDARTALLLETSLGQLVVNIFDPVVVKIRASGITLLPLFACSHELDSRAHMTKAKVELVHFGKNLRVNCAAQAKLIEVCVAY
jgi:hypothetical protein